ncbi:MAG TPA: hypothetical protein H9961_03535 [Candidatus Duodenibacillus intestinavium]|nr:hypothetical protein [Candidatus Duodenibacillus intestinavium]
MTQSTALDRLFPESMRYHKGHVADPKRKSGAGGDRSRLTRLTPRQKLTGIVRRAPEVMLKIGRANIRCLRHMKAAADYISRNGKIEIEDQDGFAHGSKEQVEAVVRQWGLQSQIPQEESSEDRRAHGRRIILSMPAGTPTEGFKVACRKWAHDTLTGHDYLIAFHTPENDQRTTQPHCHILIRTIGHDGRRFHVDNARREEMREHFAVCLREQGIEANATQRWQRGVTRRSLGQPEFHNARKVQSDKERARMHAIARKKKTLLLKTMQNRLQDVERSVRSGKPIPDPPGIVKARAKRQELTDLLNDVIDELNAGSSQDKMLALATKEHLQKLPPVKSAVQEAVSSLTDKVRHAKRAEVKRATTKNR